MLSNFTLSLYWILKILFLLIWVEQIWFGVSLLIYSCDASFKSNIFILDGRQTWL